MRRRKGIVLVVVIGILIVVFTLALVALYLMTQEARLAEHKIRRIRGLFAARAAMVHALEQARNGRYNLPANGGTCPAGGLPAVNTGNCGQCSCSGDETTGTCREIICIGLDGTGSPIPGYPANGLPVGIDFARGTGNPMDTHRIDITVDY